MKRPLILSFAFLSLVAAGGYHWHATQVRAPIEAEEQQSRAAITAERKQLAMLARDLGEARREREHLASARAAAPVVAAAPVAPVAPVATKPLSAPLDAAMRTLQVQAFVSDQRLRHASVLRRAGFDAEKLRAFDRIQTECWQVQLDPSQDAAARAEARTRRDEQLRDLFGDAQAQWLEASRNEPARTAVMQIVERTFADAGAISVAQVDELTRIFAANRTPPTARSDERYDWEPIIAAARTLLAPRQQDAFIGAIELRRATEKMNALSRKS